jgi:glycosyltransferase involved in cell wall biosynthesis
MKLSVLIASLESRNDLFKRVFTDLKNQINSNNYSDIVEVITLVDNAELTIGEKRNILKSKAKGEYICFVDDDDLLPNYYLKEIVDKLNSGYDLINFYVEHRVDGSYKKLICPNVGIDSIEINGCLFWVNMLHLCPHKKSIADLVKFPNINFCEDLEYSRELKTHIKNTFFIEKIMYHYDYKSNK